MGLLDGKVAIVTGTTAESIGRACALGMAKEGAKLIVTGRGEKGGKETERQIREIGGDALYVRQDVTVEEDWIRTIDTCVETYGRLDILLNNAGEAIVKPIEELTHDDLIFLRNVDLEGPFLGMKYAWPHLIAAGGGVILNMSSIVGQRGNPKSTAYSAIKGAQLGLTRAGAIEGAPHNIRVNSVHPDMIWTEGVPDVLGPNAEELRPSLGKNIPLGSVGEPYHVADACVYLCTDGASYVTGAEMNIDGGRSAS